jgi:hypothetical protein
MLSKHILSIELSFCLHLGLAFCLPGLCRSMAPLSPLPRFQVPLPLPLLLPLSPVPVRDLLPANVLLVLCVCCSVGNKLPPTLLYGAGVTVLTLTFIVIVISTYPRVTMSHLKQVIPV